jgi:uncharacterized protein (DUF427 family)
VSVHLRALFFSRLGELRWEPTDQRVRAVLAGHTVVDTTRARLVWEPKRIVPAYAVPEDGLGAHLVPATDEAGAAEAPTLAGRPVYDPRVPFGVRDTEGEALELRIDDARARAFRPADEAMAGYVILDFAGFDAWYAEDEPVLGHPRDPFHRIDVLHGSRHVVVEHGGRRLAESRRPRLLFEPPLPVRYYLPREDVAVEALEPSDTRTTCAYKGHATHFSLPGEADVAWTYEDPLRDAAEVAGMIAFYNERVDITVDGVLLGRPDTPWSRR